MTHEDRVLGELRQLGQSIAGVRSDLAAHRQDAAEQWGSTDARLDRLERSTDSIAPRVARLEERSERAARKLSPPGGLRVALASVPDVEGTGRHVARAQDAGGAARWETWRALVTFGLPALAAIVAGVLSAYSCEPTRPARGATLPTSSAAP